MRQIKIDSNYNGIRLYRFVKRKHKDIPLSGIFRLIRKGRVKVNGKKKKGEYILQEGDEISFYFDSKNASEPSFITLSQEEKKMAAEAVVYNDSAAGLIICNKPDGLVMHKGSGHKYGFVEIMQSCLQNKNFVFINRIDRDSAGLVIGASNLVVARRLSFLMQQRKITKYYSVVVDGLVPEDEFSLVSSLAKTGKGVQEVGEHGRRAESRFKVVKRYKNNTLLEAMIITGRTHQLRVQLANYGCPIVGDVRYGRKNKRRMLLFSRRVVIAEFGIDIEIDLPACFSEFLQKAI